MIGEARPTGGDGELGILPKLPVDWGVSPIHQGDTKRPPGLRLLRETRGPHHLGESENQLLGYSFSTPRMMAL